MAREPGTEERRPGGVTTLAIHAKTSQLTSICWLVWHHIVYFSRRHQLYHRKEDNHGENTPRGFQLRRAEPGELAEDYRTGQVRVDGRHSTGVTSDQPSLADSSPARVYGSD